ncbi:MAG TPA: type Z 30S ribosomal protein S14 [Candidatus Xenobia bacterium]|jgi:small subunit ribosomal protein S14
MAKENLAPRQRSMHKPKFAKKRNDGTIVSVRTRNRCRCCGRPRAYVRKFALCRICFRNLAHKGEIPGVVKSSW